MRRISNEDRRHRRHRAHWRPVLVGRDTQLPDYVILLSTLGGLAAFGLAGVVIGPTIAAFFLSVWQMAEQELHAGPDEQRADAPPPS